MTIETYQDSRKDEVISLIREFYDESLIEYGMKINIDMLCDSIEKYRHHSFLLIVDGKCVGLFAGFEVMSPISDEKIFHEVIWYVKKEYRLKGVYLLNWAMKILKEEGFNSMVMVVMHNSKLEKIARLYERLGFIPMETHYIKKL